MNEAGEKALPVWIAAARDPQANGWVRHALDFKFRDQDWLGKVYVAMFDLPGPLYRHLAIGALQSRPQAAQRVAPDIIEQARIWSQNDDPDEIDLVDSVTYRNIDGKRVEQRKPFERLPLRVASRNVQQTAFSINQDSLLIWVRRFGGQEP